MPRSITLLLVESRVVTMVTLRIAGFLMLPFLGDPTEYVLSPHLETTVFRGMHPVACY
jgi:hypothetical protein